LFAEQSVHITPKENDK